MHVPIQNQDIFMQTDDDIFISSLAVKNKWQNVGLKFSCHIYIAYNRANIPNIVSAPGAYFANRDYLNKHCF